jgi:hypothetical protein
MPKKAFKSLWDTVQRDEIWNNQSYWLGRVVVVKYQELSKSKNKEVASLRFATYERDRDDKDFEI